MTTTRSPYRSLPTERRIALVRHAITTSREARALYIQRILSRGGGFRAVTLQSWPAERLARTIVQTNAESPAEELELLQLLYLELEPQIQATFLDAAGVPHENGKMPEELATPYADEAAVRRGAAAVRERHGEAGEHYLRTIARYSRDGWPGIEAVVGEG